MTLEEVNANWKVDGVIDPENLATEAARIPILHNKYYMHYVGESLRTKKLRKELKILEKAKTEWLNGSMSEEELKERGWKPNPLKILRQDVDKYLDSDREVIELSLKVDYYDSVAKYLEDIIRQIHSRNYIIKSMLDWSRFQSGG